MVEVSETLLPGVGVRHEFTTGAGERVAVLTRRSGRRELLVYDAPDPDECRTAIHLDGPDSQVLAELLGGGQVSQTLGLVQQQIEGLAIEWVTVPGTSSSVGTTLGSGEFRTRTGASIVAVVRGDITVAAPGPEERLEAGDVLVAIGTSGGLDQLRRLLAS